MLKKALVIIDIQNDITKNYKDIIDNINTAIDWATNNDIHVVYITCELKDCKSVKQHHQRYIHIETLPFDV